MRTQHECILNWYWAHGYALAHVVRHRLPDKNLAWVQLMLHKKWSYEVKNRLDFKQSLNKTKNKVQLDVSVCFITSVKVREWITNFNIWRRAWLCFSCHLSQVYHWILPSSQSSLIIDQPVEWYCDHQCWTITSPHMWCEHTLLK